MSTQIRTLQNPNLLHPLISSLTFSRMAGSTEVCTMLSPRNIIAKPIIIIPRLLRFLLLPIVMINPTAISGTATVATPPENPTRANNQADTVVPLLAPIMTPILWARVSSPALTKLTTIRVVAAEDWIHAVTVRPVSTLLKALEVIIARNPLSLSPATFCRFSLIMLIPNRNKAREPRSLNIDIAMFITTNLILIVEL